MKFQITMKDPDGFYDAIHDAAKDWADKSKGLEDDEWDDLIETKKEKLSEMVKKWFRYSEYLTVEIDTEAQTCVVVPNE